MTERSNSSRDARGMNKALDVSYNEQSGGLKVVGPIMGQLKRLFVVSAVMAISEPAKSGAVIGFYNPTATTAWLTISETAIDPAIPSAVEPNSIALRPNDYTFLAMPYRASKVRSSEPTVVAYLMLDDSSIK